MPLSLFPTENDAAMLKAVLPLTDVMGTGHHAAVSAGVRKGATIAVVGDGAVGLCGVLAARRLGAERIIVLDIGADAWNWPKIRRNRPRHEQRR